MSKAGWYPDPGGQQGMFRWWDGQQWTPQLTAHPFAGPPQPPTQPPFAGPGQPGPAGVPHDPTQPLVTGSGQPLPLTDGSQPTWQAAYDPAGAQRSSRGPMLILLLVGLLLVGLIAGAFVLLSGGRIGPIGGERPASNPTADLCPRRSAIQESPPPPHVHPAGRVQGGALSYPQLGSPWGPIQEEVRVPFGRDVYGQDVMLEENYDNLGSSWVASLVVGELVAGDGFFSPEEGAEIITRCVLGVFYADAELGRTDRVNQATSVDGHDAWLIEMHLTFDIPGLSEKGETAIIMVVNTGEASASLYYASIPDSRPDLLATARQIQGQLRVES